MALRDAEVWLAPISGTRVLVPFRVSIPTPLGLGVLVSFGTAYFVSKTFLRLLVQSGSARNPALYGVETAVGGQVA